MVGARDDRPRPFPAAGAARRARWAGTPAAHRETGRRDARGSLRPAAAGCRRRPAPPCWPNDAARGTGARCRACRPSARPRGCAPSRLRASPRATAAAGSTAAARPAWICRSPAARSSGGYAHRPPRLRARAWRSPGRARRADRAARPLHDRASAWAARASACL